MAVLRRSIFLSPVFALSGRESVKRVADAQRGRLSARPGKPSSAVAPGLHPVDLAAGRDGLLYVPSSYSPEKRSPLIVSLHGAGGTAQRGLNLVQPLADRDGYLVLAPDSRGRTWDVILGGLGPDVEFLDQALESVFSRCNVNARRLAVGGFSDGASYALTLGIVNGALFTHVIAFSPGFLTAPERSGRPEIFVSHGTHDQVLPIDACSRRIVPRLKDAGYSVNYVEFNGPHQVPPKIRDQAVKWFID